MLPRKIEITKHDVHVWKIALDATDIMLDKLAATLSSQEQGKSNRFKFAKHRHRYIASQGAVRLILSHYLELTPERIIFKHNRYGKPELANVNDRCSLQFNLTHSRVLALLAIADNRRVGIDLEWLDRPTKVRAIADRFFAPEEAAEIKALPSALQRKAFFRCWTAKEAYLKAIGIGLHGSLSDNRILNCHKVSSDAMRLVQGVKENKKWTIIPIEVSDDYIATLVAEDNSFHVSHWNIDDWDNRGSPKIQ